jgi:Carbohydrate-selective porin, OprB family
VRSLLSFKLTLKNVLMKIWTHQLNWLTITAGGLIATLLLASNVRATASITTTANNSQFSSPQLVAVAARKKKRMKRKQVRVRTQVKPATTSSAPTTSPTDVTQTPPPPIPTQVTPPPAPSEPSVTREEVEALRRSNQELRERIDKIDGNTTETTKKIEQLDKQQFSINTKLEGQVIFGATGLVSGDFDRNTAAGYRARLELKTAIGEGKLTTRLQSDNLGSATAATPEGKLSWTGDGAGTLAIDALKYEFPLTPQTQLVVAANAGASDDFTDTINPYFDGDGASGSISAFGNRPSIYYTVQGAGAGIRHKLSDGVELSLGYLSSTSSTPTTGNGLFGGNYGALAQLTFATGENSKVGVTYTRTRNSDLGTGSTTANQGGDSNNFGVQGSFSLSPQLAVGGWAGYTQNQLAGVDRQIWNWAVTAAAPDFGGKGNIAGLLVGQSPRVTSASNGVADTKAGLHLEGFYQLKVSDSLSITPGIIYLTAPNHDVNSQPAVIGALRSTFTF